MLSVPQLLKKVKELEDREGKTIAVSIYSDGSGFIMNESGLQEVMIEFDDLVHLEQQLNKL